MKGTRALAIGLAIGGVLPALRAQPPARMAAERGCYNCHGEPPRQGVRSFAEIAGSYAHLRNKPRALEDAVDRMHHGSLFTRVPPAHERLSDEDADVLVRWLFQGGA